MSELTNVMRGYVEQDEPAAAKVGDCVIRRVDSDSRTNVFVLGCITKVRILPPSPNGKVLVLYHVEWASDQEIDTVITTSNVALYRSNYEYYKKHGANLIFGRA